MKKVSLILAGFLLYAATSLEAALINPGFEAGTTAGWLTSGPANVVTSHTAESSTYLPQEGSFFLMLAGGSAGVYTTAEQSVVLGEGEGLSGSAALDAHDYLPFLDDAFVRIYDDEELLLATLWSSDTSIVGNYGDGPWTPWSWNAPGAGTYTLRYGVRNTIDSSLSPHALFDAYQGQGVIPEPTSLSLLGMGLLGLAKLRRKK